MNLAIRNKYLISIPVILLQCLTFLLPLLQGILPLFIILFAISSVFNFILFKTKFRLNKTRLFLIGFYLFLGIGLFWTENKPAGVFDLEVKLSLFLFPLLFSLIDITQVTIIKIIKSLTLGVLVFFCIAIFNSFSAYLASSSNVWAHHFLYTRLSTYIHPSYMSMYIVTVMAFILYFIKKGIYVFRSKKLTWAILVLLFIINFMVLSKVGVIVSVLLFVYHIIIWITVSKKYLLGVLGISTLAMLFFVSYLKVEYVSQRVDELTNVFTGESEELKNKSSGIRVEIWKQGIVLVKNHPIFGYGTGDVKDVLVESYKLNQTEAAIAGNYNAHNQFLQLLISGGVILLVLMFMSFYFGIKTNEMFLVFILLILPYMFVESILENQAGTIFFGLFFSLFSQHAIQIKIKESRTIQTEPHLIK
jgi:O-antigen ligase